MANNQTQFNGIEVVRAADGMATGASSAVGARVPAGAGNSCNSGLALHVGSGGTGDLTVKLQGRMVTRTGTKGSWVDLNTFAATAADTTIVEYAAIGPMDEYRGNVTTAHSGGSGGTYHIWILADNNSTI